MEPDSWTRLSFASKRHQSSLQSRYGFEELDGGDEEPRAEFFPCPFRYEDFDIIGLCCHIGDEHPVEPKNGVCPVCAARVGTDLVAHMTMQHVNFFKMQRRRFRRGLSGSNPTLSVLRKELREGNLQALLGRSTFAVPPPNAAPDPFLSSLIYTWPVTDSSRDAQAESLEEECLVSKSSDVKVEQSVEPYLSETEQKERACRSEFVQGLVLSTIFEDDGL